MFAHDRDSGALMDSLHTEEQLAEIEAAKKEAQEKMKRERSQKSIRGRGTRMAGTGGRRMAPPALGPRGKSPNRLGAPGSKSPGRNSPGRNSPGRAKSPGRAVGRPRGRPGLKKEEPPKEAPKKKMIRPGDAAKVLSNRQSFVPMMDTEVSKGLAQIAASHRDLNTEKQLGNAAAEKIILSEQETTQTNTKKITPKGAEEMLKHRDSFTPTLETDVSKRMLEGEKNIPKAKLSVQLARGALEDFDDDDGPPSPPAPDHSNTASMPDPADIQKVETAARRRTMVEEEAEAQRVAKELELQNKQNEAKEEEEARARQEEADLALQKQVDEKKAAKAKEAEEKRERDEAKRLAAEEAEVARKLAESRPTPPLNKTKSFITANKHKPYQPGDVHDKAELSESTDAKWLLEVLVADKDTWRDFALVTLQNLSVTEENRVPLIQTYNALDAYVEVLKDSDLSPDNRATAMYTLHALSMAEANRATMASHAALVEQMVLAMGYDTGKSLNSAAGTLQSMCASNGQHDTIGTSKVVSALLGLLSNADDSKVSEYACVGLANLIDNGSKEWQLQLLNQAEHIQLMTEALRTSANAKIRHTICHGFQTLCGSEEIVLAMIRDRPDVFDSLMAMAGLDGDTATPAFPDTEYACAVIYQATSHSKCRQDLMEHPNIVTGMSLLLQSSHALSEATKATQYCSGVLYYLAVHGGTNSDTSVFQPLLPSVPAMLQAEGISDAATLHLCGVVYHLSTNEANRDSLVSTTAVVKVLLWALNAERTPTNAKQFCAATIHNLSSTNTIERLVGECEVLAPLVQAVSSVTGKPRSLACASLQIVALKGEDPHREKMVEAGVLPVLVATSDVSEGGKDGQKLKEMCYGIMYGLAYCSSVRVKMAETEGVVAAMLRALGDESVGSQKTRDFAASVMHNLSFATENRQPLVHKLGTLPVVASALKSALKSADQSQQTKIREPLFRLMNNLAQVSENRAAFVATNGMVALLLETCEAYVDDSDPKKAKMGEWSAQTMYMAILLEENVEPLLKEHGALAPSIRCLKRASAGKCQDYLCGVVWLLLSKQAKINTTGMVDDNTVSELGAGDAVTAVLTMEGSSSNAKTYACQTGKLLVEPDSNKTAMLRTPGLVDSLVNMIYARTSPTTELSLFTLSRIAALAEAKSELLKHKGVLPSLIAAASSNTESKQRTHAMTCLWMLSMNEDNQTVLVRDSKVMQAIVSVLEDENAASKIIMFALLILRYLSSKVDNAVELVEEHAVLGPFPALIPKQEGKESDLVFTVLFELSRQAEDNKDMFVEDTKLMEALISALSIDTKKHRAAKVLRNLPLTEEYNKTVNSELKRMGMSEDQAYEALDDDTKQALEAEQDELDQMVHEENFKHCTHVMRELVETERTYVSKLKGLREHFADPLAKTKKAKSLRITDIFKDVEAIIQTHDTLLSNFDRVTERERKHWPLEFAKCLKMMAPFLKQSSSYINRFDEMMKLVDALPKDKYAAKVLEEGKRQTRLNLQAHMIMPIQRIPRLELLIRDLIKHMRKGDEGLDELIQTFEELQEVARSCDVKKADSDQKYRLATLALEYKGLPPDVMVLEPGRIIKHEGKVKWLEDRKLVNVKAVLFSDMLLWSTSASEGGGGEVQQYKGHMMLKDKTTKGNKEVLSIVKAKLSEDEYKTLDNIKNVWISKHMKKRLKEKNQSLTSDGFKSKVGDLPLLGMTVFGEQAALGGYDPNRSGDANNVQRNLSLGMVLFESTD